MNNSVKEKQKTTMCQIGDVFNVLNGLWTGKSNDRIDCKVIRNTNFQNNGLLNFENIANIKVDRKTLLLRELKTGDIILEKSGGSDTQPVGRVVLFNLKENNYSFSNFTSCLRLKDNRLDNKYLFYCLYYFWLFGKTKELQQKTTGIRNLDMNRYLKLRVFLPSIEKQKKIAEILGSIDRSVSTTQKTIDQSEQLKKSLMQHLFTHGISHTKFKQTEIGEIPESWKIDRLKNVAKVERGKFGHRPRNDKDFYGGDFPFIQTGDVVNSNGRIRTYSQTLNQKGLSVSRMFPAGTIVLTIAANIGSTAILEIDSCFPDSLVGITPNDGINNLYLEYFLRTKADYLNSIATQSAQKNINLEKLNPLLVAVPPIEEQEKIAEILQSIDEQIEVNKKLKAKQEQLKQGLMQDLLTGKVAI